MIVIKNGNILKSNKKINILGVIFDSKLQWYFMLRETK